MESQDIIKKKVWTTKDIFTVALVCISLTFSATLIWGRFLFMEGEVKKLKNDIEYVDQRHDRKYDRIEDRIIKLEEPNTDRN